jgi:hypothetical protein
MTQTQKMFQCEKWLSQIHVQTLELKFRNIRKDFVTFLVLLRIRLTRSKVVNSIQNSILLVIQLVIYLRSPQSYTTILLLGSTDLCPPKGIAVQFSLVSLAIIQFSDHLSYVI